MNTYQKIALGVVPSVAMIIMCLIDREHAEEPTNAHDGYGACGRCSKTWDVVSGHCTPYKDCKWEVTTPKGEDLAFQVVDVPNDGGTHTVTVTNGTSCFPLCEQCWKDLTPSTRLPFYRKMMDERVSEWNKRPELQKYPNPELDWPAMKSAVLAGK